MNAAQREVPSADADRAAARLRSRGLGLGFRQRGLGQDARAGAARVAPVARRRAARRAFSASPSPRRRRPTCRRGSSRNWAGGPRFRTKTSRTRSYVPARPGPREADLDFARKLFARTIETPGGLKIQTIHAFCERLLHLFPFEANVPAGFRVLEEREAGDLLRRARGAAFERALRDPDLAAAVERIARIAGADGFDALLSATLRRREELAASGGASAYAARLRRRLGLAPDESVETIQQEMFEGGGGPRRWRDWASKLGARRQDRPGARQQPESRGGARRCGPRAVDVSRRLLHAGRPAAQGPRDQSRRAALPRRGRAIVRRAGSPGAARRSPALGRGRRAQPRARHGRRDAC